MELNSADLYIHVLTAIQSRCRYSSLEQSGLPRHRQTKKKIFCGSLGHGGLQAELPNLGRLRGLYIKQPRCRHRSALSYVCCVWGLGATRPYPMGPTRPPLHSNSADPCTNNQLLQGETEKKHPFVCPLCMTEQYAALAMIGINFIGLSAVMTKNHSACHF
ncbi:hypothetical protein BX600DRAFT_461654 [Xylariales sp. PMI_506]|nr:hypothetical protein BX600DRAFT_461654 [Xylariales sp. PMI_506]